MKDEALCCDDLYRTLTTDLYKTLVSLVLWKCDMQLLWQTNMNVGYRHLKKKCSKLPLTLEKV